MEIVGRLTTDAKVNETKNGIRVVNFSLAVNDRFKTGSGEIKEQVTFFNCSYWMSSGIAEHLLKGSLVEVSGRVCMVKCRRRAESQPEFSCRPYQTAWQSKWHQRRPGQYRARHR